MKRPKILKKGYFRVTDGHRLYYEVCGNPRGVPVIFFHGGPGGGFSDKDKEFFDFKKYKVVYFDQRGAGRSKPFAGLKANTTWKLVEDANKLLDFLNIKKVFIFGGSWGSTLSLVYSINNPDRVLGLQLRGIFLCTEWELKYFYHGGVKIYAQDKWERFSSLVPPGKRKSLMRYYLNKMQSKDPKVKERYTYEWAYYEIALCKLYMPEEKIEETLGQFSYQSLAPIEAHYFVNNCFMPDNYILKNVKRISHLPVSIVHGRYDLVCPPISAFRLKKKLPNARFHIVTAGHSASEKEITRILKGEMNRIYRENVRPWKQEINN